VRDNPNPPPLTTTLDVVGGSIGLTAGNLTAYDSSHVNISGGTVGYGGGSFDSYNSSVVNISGGSVASSGNVDARNSSVMNISGGTVAFVGNLNAHNQGVVNISGGSVAFTGKLSSFDSSKINISGGTIAQFGSLNAHDSSVITIFGSGFSLPNGVVTQTSGSLTGTLGDGSPLNVQFATFNQGEIVLSQPLPIVTVTVAGGVYNGLPHAVTGAAVTGISNVTLASFGDPSLSYAYYAGGTASGIPSASAPTSAGTYTVVAHWTSNNPSYTSADSAPVTFTITPLPVTVTGITANTKMYDAITAATLNVGAAGLAGVLAGDTVSLNTSVAVGKFASKDVSNGISVTVSGLTIDGPQAGNYTLVQPGTTGNIVPAPVTVAGVTASSKVYDATTKAALNTANSVLVGVFAGDMVTLNLAGATGTFAGKDVGLAIPVAVSGLTIGGSQANDYALIQPTTSANIVPANVVATGITANDKVYDGTTNATLNTANAALLGVFLGDSVILNSFGAVGTFSSKDVGSSIKVAVSGLTLNGAQAADYTLTQPTTVASITPLALTVAGATANNKIYDTTKKATINTTDALLIGVLAGDKVTLVWANAAATFAIPGVGNDIPVTVSGLALAGPQASDYTLNQPLLLAASILPDLTVNPLIAKVGVPATLTGIQLRADSASLPGTVVYTLVSVPASGTLKDGAATLVVGSTFTQADINSGKLTYTGTAAGSDAIQFSATDGQGGTVPVNTLSITVEPNIPLPTVFVNSLSNLEGLSGLTPFVFQVKLPNDGSGAGPVIYDVYTSNGTAKAGINYVPISAGDALHGGLVTFSGGSNVATVTVYVIGGSLAATPGAATATFTVNLSDPSNPGVPVASGTGTIIAQSGRLSIVP
jgi:hypothetical protein